MASSNDVTLPAMKRTRKSIGAQLDFSKSREKENATIDVASTLAASRKRSRSKSIGPGGLDSLRQGHGNRRASLAVPPNPPRSILKATIAPLPEIPPLKKGRQMPFTGAGNARGFGATGAEAAGSRIALKTEEQQQAAAREREERDRRDARRKSLANRRVSFAAEATLHTFHEIEDMNDASKSHGQAPASSDSQGKKRRGSLAAQPDFPNVDDDMTAASSIYSSDSEPADAVEEIAADEEEEVEEDSNSDSDDGTMMSVVTEEITGTSMGSNDSAEGDEADEADQSSTLDEALRMAARRAATQQLDEGSDDGEEIIPSFGWARKGNQQSTSTTSQPRPNVSNPEHDADQDDDNEAMDMEVDMDTDMEMTRAMGKIITKNAEPTRELEQDVSMDVTRVLGGVLPRHEDKDGYDSPMEEATMEFTTAIGGIHRSRSTGSHNVDEDEVNDDDGNEDLTMELTTVMGGLLKAKNDLARRRTLSRRSEVVPMEDATMDMTVGLGRIVSAPKLGSEEEAEDEGENEQGREEDEDQEHDASMAMDTSMGMEITTGLGKIISAPRREEEDGYNDATMGMDMTMEMGGIIKDTAPSPQPSEDIWLLGNGLDKANDAQGEKTAAGSQPSPEKEVPLQLEDANARGSASAGILKLRTQALRQSIASRMALDIEEEARTPSPSRPSAPQQVHLNRSPTRATPQSSPIRTPQSALKGRPRPRSTSRTPSPEKATPRLRRTPSPEKATPRLRRSLLCANPDVSARPTIVLTPQARTPTGIGADRNGLGSPQAAAILERRGSLVDSASKFIPGTRTVGFKDPRELMDEVDRENDAERSRTGGSQGSQGEKEATLNLREMIDSLSPKRNPLRGRKSLHVGSARGLLGKRPQDSDNEEEAEDGDGVKRLKGPQGSPLKTVRPLQQHPLPPSKEESTGRFAKSLHGSLEQVGRVPSLSFSSPMRREMAAQTPVVSNQTVHDVSVHESPVVNEAQKEDDGGNRERIHLQDFLNMTSIRFMELTTTKRRPTMMPAAFQRGESGYGGDDLSLELCVVAGACTVPMLELYQHSCRELKKYISEGRKIVKEIETETFQENPLLFQEYIAATPEVKALMDNQFKNVKTHARHLSKAMWYEWRMKLQDGLKEGLMSIGEGMEGDETLLAQQESLLSSVMPAIRSRYESLLVESSRLEESAKELADCDPVQLQAARDELVSLDEDVAAKKLLVEKLRKELETSEADAEALSRRKQKCLEEIEEAEGVREECRGWTSHEVNSLKARVDAIEKEHGWTVTGISGSTLSMTYKHDIELVFDVASFQSPEPASRIDLWYIGDRREPNPQPKTLEKEFFLQCIRDHVRALPQSQTRIATLLDAVQRAWDNANLVSRQIARTNVSFPTRVTRTSDASIAMTSSLLLKPLETRVEITLHLSGGSGPEGVSVEIVPEAKVVYGEQFNVGKVGEFLASRIGSRVGSGQEEWSSVVLELHEKLIARGKKQ